MVLAIAAVLSTGCGEVLDWRNAEVSSGKIFRRGADEPFSGKLTGVPDTRILPFNQWLQLIRPIEMMGPTRNVRKAGAVCAVKVSKGNVDGKLVCEDPETKSVQTEMEFSDGVPDGDVVLTNGKNKIMTAAFKEGRLHGEQEVFSPATGKRVFRANWVNGKYDGELAFYRDDTGVKTGSNPYRNGVIDGEVIEYTPEGKVLTRKTYREGQEDGIEERFHPVTSKKLFEKHFTKGMPSGEFRRWDESGTLIEHKAHGPGYEIRDLLEPKPVANLDACLQKWIAAHHKNAGADAPIRQDVLEEWKDECRTGKTPG